MPIKEGREKSMERGKKKLPRGRGVILRSEKASREVLTKTGRSFLPCSRKGGEKSIGESERFYQ